MAGVVANSRIVTLRREGQREYKLHLLPSLTKYEWLSRPLDGWWLITTGVWVPPRCPSCWDRAISKDNVARSRRQEC